MFHELFVTRAKARTIVPQKSGESSSRIGGDVPSAALEVARRLGKSNEPRYFMTLDGSMFCENCKGAISLFYYDEVELIGTWTLVMHDSLTQTDCRTGHQLAVEIPTEDVCQLWGAPKNLGRQGSKIGGKPGFIQGQMHETDRALIKKLGLEFVGQIDVEDIGDLHPHGSVALLDGAIYIFARIDVFGQTINFDHHYIIAQNT